jgi:ketosteroid isomerase-like protein
MSHANVELVLAFRDPPDVNLVPLLRDDDLWAAKSELVASLLHPDFEYVVSGLPGGERIATGIDGMRAGFLDWMTPWASYRSEVEEAIDLGDRVLLLVHNFGRLEGSTAEVKISSANIWTVRDGKIARAEFFTTLDDALKAAGLEG